MLVVVTGVAGSGKSLAVHGSLAKRDAGGGGRPSPDPRGSRRSNPATYTGLLDPIRKAFAKGQRCEAGAVQRDSAGACPTCNGAGVIYSDLAIMAGVATPCELCEGKRYQADVLQYELGGKDIAEVLACRWSPRPRSSSAPVRRPCRPPTSSSASSSTSGWATSPSVGR